MIWEPARLVDASRAPWCFPNLGGLNLDAGLPAGTRANGFFKRRWRFGFRLARPLLRLPAALVDRGAARLWAAWKAGGLDIAWVSELDPAWRDDELSFLLNPEAALFADLPAQAACAADCAAASAGLPLDPLYWCAGCQGGMYPLTGNVGAHVGGVQASLLAAQRLVFRLHRLLLAWGTSGSAALCGRYPMPIMKKSQYRWQMTQPVPATSPLTGCNPTGRSTVLWEALRELPVAGREFRVPALAQAKLLSPLRKFIMGCKVIHKTVMALSCVPSCSRRGPHRPRRRKAMKKRRARWWKGYYGKRKNPPQAILAPGRVR